MGLDQVRRVLETFEVRQNEFTWDDTSVKEAMDAILNVVDIDFETITSLALSTKLKNVGLHFAHSISINYGLCLIKECLTNKKEPTTIAFVGRFF